ncbi:MAG: TrkH family potassium uptake protein [Treponema sp.]|jgi:trk system potassium uptake protein TrkH|nr:TrkH family potassium uptake protein [Treponema sp.]
MSVSRAAGGLKLLAVFSGLIALTMAVPLIAALVLSETEMIRAFAVSIGAIVCIAAPALIFNRGRKIRFRASDGFILVFLIWVIACLAGALPFRLSGFMPRFTDAVFEAVSGFTTTGITLAADVEALPRSLLLWRAMTHWLGGMGIVVLTVALLPLMGIGGFQLIKAETTGPEKERITPKITATAKILWLLYIGFTALLCLLLALGGMSWFDALLHSFSTMATGGFSSRNAGIAAWRSPFIDWVCFAFMILAGLNFSLLYQIFRGKPRDILRNSEARAYGFIILAAGIGIALSLISAGTRPAEAFRHGFFHSASVLTTTGFTAANYGLWPPLAQGILFTLMLIGGCSGSTAGGIKVIRYVVLLKQTGNEIKRLIYPRGVFNIQLNKKVGRKDVVYGVAGFVFLYFVLILAAFFLVSSAGIAPFSSLNLALLTLGNVGLGLGGLIDGSVAAACPGYVKWGLCFMMIAGRLELWTALVIFSPEYWRR